MIPGGYIIQPRCFDESEAARLPPVTRELWFYLLRKVNHKDNGKFKRGHGFFALEDIQKDLSWMVGYRREMYSKPQLTKSLRRLREGNMIETTKATRGVFVSVCKYDIYQDCKQYEGNDEGRTKGERRENEGIHLKQECKNERIEKEEDIVEQPPRQREIIPYAEIISYLNTKTGKNFNPSTQATKSHIRARWAEKFRIDDFKAVIDYKTDEWATSSEMNQYLRPTTLFGTKFESYLQTAKNNGGEEASLYGKYGKWKN